VGVDLINARKIVGWMVDYEQSDRSVSLIAVIDNDYSRGETANFFGAMLLQITDPLQMSDSPSTLRRAFVVIPPVR
jgi:hypothetical protein